jgi:RNA polymerase sigma-70 factor (sigma-E family)
MAGVRSDVQEGRVGTLDLAAFVGVHYGELRRRAYLLTGSLADAEDLVQEALARTWEASRGRPVDLPRAYAHRTMVNLYVSRWRRRLLRQEDPVADVPEPTGGTEVDAAGGVAERDRLWRALGALPAKQRAVLVLRFYEDLTETAAAEVLGVTVGTVRSQTWKGLRRLEAALGTDDEGGANRG